MTPTRKPSTALGDAGDRPRWKLSERDFWMECFGAIMSALHADTLGQQEVSEQRLSEEEKEQLLGEDLVLAARIADKAVLEMQWRFQIKGRLEKPSDRKSTT